MDLFARAGTLAVAAALLFIARRLHKASSRNPKKTKIFACVLAFLSGCAFLTTFVGDWMGSLAGSAPAFAVAGLIACVGIIAVDIGVDGKPDGAAFWSAFALAMFVVFGAASLPRAGDQIGDGVKQVSTQISQVGR